ncbi:MAG: hypothetical protein AAGA10_01590 [Bacteroidota bacterium]
MMYIWKLFPLLILSLLLPTSGSIGLSDGLLQPSHLFQEKTLNQEVISFAESKKGLKVGRGECWDLAQQALTYAGARNSTDYRSQTRNENYIWGKEISLDKAKPGDVIQYRNFGGTKRETQTNGSWQEVRFEASHHTAILAKSLPHGAWEVFHQNNQGQQFVTRDTITLWNTEYMQGESTVSVSVKGKFWIYRPQER